VPLTAAAVKERALALGFDLCGVAPAEAFPELGALAGWLERGFAGEMRYLARTADERADPRRVLPSARTVVALGTVYNVDRPYSTEVGDPGEALIARYAWGDDYHDVIGRRLEALVAWMRETAGAPFDARAYVDTGPVQERVLAARAGLGWIGRNACLIHPELGSWLLLAEILTSLDLDADAPGTDRCGTCTLCLDACPTGALVEPGLLDARRCVAYLTIELKGPIPEPIEPGIGSHVFGCDVCQEVCPWNQVAARSSDPAWQPRPQFDRPRLDDLAARSDDDLRWQMRGSAMRRAGVRRLRRNLEVALRHRGAGPGV